MNFVSGRVWEFLRDANGGIEGILLDNGKKIRFSATLWRAISPVVNEGCLVEAEGVPSADGFAEGSLLASRITKLESKQGANLPTPVAGSNPGMPPRPTPTESASLPHRVSPYRKDENRAEWPVGRDSGTIIPDLIGADSAPQHPTLSAHGFLQGNGGQEEELERTRAGRSLWIAYDSLHRIQAILAYLHIMKHRVPGIGQLLDEAKHTYGQSLARFSARDFAGAKEFAEASGSLSRVIEIVMARTLRSDSNLPSLVPPPPAHAGGSSEPEHVEEDLAQAEAILSRIHWLLEHGTLPPEDRAQVRKITSWGDAFYKQARRTYGEAVLEDAAEFAEAALAGAYSAEHVCRKWYLGHSARP